MAVSFNGMVSQSVFTKTNNTDIKKMMEEMKKLQNGEVPSDVFTKATTATGSNDNDPQVKAAKEEEAAQKAKLAELTKKRDEKIKEMEQVQKKIEKLAKEIATEISNAIAQQEDAVKENNEESKKVIQEQIAAYVEANKNGEGMTYAQLQANIANNLPDGSNITAATNALAKASGKLGKMDALIDELKKLRNELSQLLFDIDNQEQAVNTAEQAVEAAEQAAEARKSCDPIGFTATDENGNTAQYDFIYDDGDFDSTNDFVGSQTGFMEMHLLDKDGNGTLTADELEAGNVKVVKKDAAGNQTTLGIKEAFGEDFSIDLNSYQAGGTHSSVNTNTDHDADGTADQTLLGTFNVNLDGKTVQGYNTLDDVDWLSDTYNIENEPNIFAPEEQDEVTFTTQPIIAAWNQTILEDEKISKDLNKRLKSASRQVGFGNSTFHNVYNLHYNSTAEQISNKKSLNEDEKALYEKWDNEEDLTLDEAKALLALFHEKNLASADEIAELEELIKDAEGQQAA